VAGKSNMPLDLLDEEDDVNGPADSIAALEGSQPASHTPLRYEKQADRNLLRPNVTLPDSVCTVVSTPSPNMEFLMRFA